MWFDGFTNTSRENTTNRFVNVNKCRLKESENSENTNRLPEEKRSLFMLIVCTLWTFSVIVTGIIKLEEEMMSERLNVHRTYKENHPNIIPTIPARGCCGYARRHVGLSSRPAVPNPNARY